MDLRRAVPAAVLGLGGILAAVGIVTYATGDPPDYADLVPAPDSIIWELGQESTVLVSTNREDVDLRIDSVALGIANVQGSVPHSGVLMVLGASVGCQDWAVSRLYADAISTGGYTLKGNVDRDNFVGTAEVHHRQRVQGGEWGPGPGSPIDVDYVSGDEAASNYFEESFNVGNDVWEVEASSDASFPVALTRFITIDTTAGTSSTDAEVESVVLLQGTGVGLKACSEHDDVILSLHGDEGAELNRYVVDIGAAPPAPTATPRPDAGWDSRRVCVDDGASRATYLTGDEKVGAAFASSDFELSGNITAVDVGDVEEGNDFRYFFEDTISGAEVQLTVSKAGAGDRLGLDADRIYPVRVTVTAGGVTAYLDVGVWLDTTVVSPNDDGLCS